MDITKKVIKSKYIDKIESLEDFARRFNVTVPAIEYACKKDKLDYIRLDRKTAIVLTELSLSYKPNANSRRKSILQTSK